ncbi:MAG: hypothetical protein H7333_00605 [Bdellovibrionales bacterium]|nr:hypothetical protein [Oligoflexia bacterium]
MTKTKKNFVSISALVFGLVLASGCGQKVAGTYTLSQSGQQAQMMNCSQITLNLSSSSSQVQASGSNGTCTESLTGTDLGNGTIQVTSLTMMGNGSYNQNTSGMPSCVFSGTLTVTNNQVSGMLNSASSGNGYCGTIQITGTKY